MSPLRSFETILTKLTPGSILRDPAIYAPACAYTADGRDMRWLICKAVREEMERAYIPLGRVRDMTATDQEYFEYFCVLAGLGLANHMQDQKSFLYALDTFLEEIRVRRENATRRHDSAA